MEQFEQEQQAIMWCIQISMKLIEDGFLDLVKYELREDVKDGEYSPPKPDQIRPIIRELFPHDEESDIDLLARLFAQIVIHGYDKVRIGLIEAKTSLEN